MYKLVFLLLIYEHIMVVHVSGNTCGRFFPLGKGHVKIHTEILTWDEARETCVDESAQLLSPLNPTILKIMIEKIRSSNIPCDAVFTGFHNTFTPTDFYSVEGIKLNDLGHLKYSINGSETKCPEIPPKSVIILKSDGTLEITDKKEQLPFFCFANTAPPKETCTCSNKEAAIIENYCYWISTEIATWEGATKKCSDEDAQLAVFKTKTEAVHFYHTYWRITRTEPAQITDGVWIGVYYGEFATFRTFFGQPLDAYLPKVRAMTWTATATKLVQDLSERNQMTPRGVTDETVCAYLIVGTTDPYFSFGTSYCKKTAPYICRADPI